MDKERLLTYFHEHYLPRREVLFRLPLSFPISSFWPELLAGRKASAVMLPLHNAAGRPCWYVLTGKMIAASELLAEEALAIEEPLMGFEMTTAMTKEMYFTSFIEGAQISFEDAMGFLERGTEPENIMEQMILNNQQAWSAMVNSLYHPLDENYIMALARMLTINMDNEVESYRQTDTHPIVAMRDEPYNVPPADSLPDRMSEFYRFLSDPDIHPLIKAAAGQAFLLITRPFPEGNERLSRMVSAAVLMRSGYDFFRDISLSSAIAAESYLYYRSMCEILRTENEGDLTYFIEYFLELLARSLKAKKEFEQKEAQAQHEEALAAERHQAKQPLGMSSEKAAPVDTVPFPKPAASEIVQADLQSYTQQAFEVPEFSTNEPVRYDISPSLEAALQELENGPSEIMVKACGTLRDMIARGITRFDGHQWRMAFKSINSRAKAALKIMQQKSIIAPQFISASQRLYVIQGLGETSLPENEYTDGSSSSEAVPPDDSGDDDSVSLESISPPEPSHENEITPDDSSSPELYLLLSEMTQKTATIPDRRIASFLLSKLEQKQYTFTTQEYHSASSQSEKTDFSDLRLMMNLGLIIRSSDLHSHYTICLHPKTGFNISNLTPQQRDGLTLLFDKFHGAAFSVGDCTPLLGQSESSAVYHLNNFEQRGLITQNKVAGKASSFTLCVSPDRHPECFNLEMLSELNAAG